MIPKRGSESPLILYLQGKKKPQMPFGSAPLPEAQIALLQKWIDQLPEEEPAVALRKAEAAVTLSEKQLAVCASLSTRRRSAYRGRPSEIV